MKVSPEMARAVNWWLEVPPACAIRSTSTPWRRYRLAVPRLVVPGATHSPTDSSASRYNSCSRYFLHRRGLPPPTLWRF